MHFLKAAAKFIFCLPVSAGVGGAGGGFVWTFVEILPITTSGEGPIGGVILALLTALNAAVMLGGPFGLSFGLIPTFLVGLLLMQLWRWPMFRPMWMWGLVGAASGAIVAALLPNHELFSSKLAWVAGGTVAMLTFRAISTRMSLLSRPSPQPDG